MTTGAGLRIADLTVTYPGPRRKGFRRPAPMTAVRNVSLDVDPDETVALVGESGSGKSTIARAIVGLVTPISGSIDFNGSSLLNEGARDHRTRKRIAMIFQDPRSS